MPGKRRRTPQEKKELSYAKDRRNAYGENDKSSRKNIPRNKRRRHRTQRHHRRQQLSAALGRVDEQSGERAEQALSQARIGGRWRKFPDVPLSVHVRRIRERRARDL